METQFKVGIAVLLLVCAGFVLYSYDHADTGIKLMSDDDFLDINTETIYQGPVPESYDVDHFRKTGETIKKDVIANGQ